MTLGRHRPRPGAEDWLTRASDPRAGGAMVRGYHVVCAQPSDPRTRRRRQPRAVEPSGRRSHVVFFVRES
jgi:hypothetical protein